VYSGGNGQKVVLDIGKRQKNGRGAFEGLAKMEEGSSPKKANP
jgi:hypothetical protein